MSGVTDFSTGLRTAACPGCARSLTGDRRWPLWCPDCGWGLDDPTTDLKRRARRRRERMHQRVLAEHRRILAKGPQPQGLLRAVAMTLAVVVHLFTVALAAVGMLMWLLPMPVLLKVILSGLLLLGAWETRPRFGRLADRPVLRRADAPHTFALLDQACAIAGARPIDVVVPTSLFNASAGFAGLRPRESVLSIGLPLWNTLDRDEKLALLGHELGHFVNGDLRETLLVGTALTSLRKWEWFLAPDRFYVRIHRGPRVRRASFSDRVGALLLLPFATVMGTFAKALGRVATLASQRSEYRADTLAATLGGRAAALRLLNGLYFDDATVFAMKVALRTDQKADIWAVGRGYQQSLPDAERERVRRNGDRALHRTDSWHPPTALRTELVAATPDRGPAIHLDAEQERLVDAELMSLEPYVRELLIARIDR
jgi:Zn-dependent protease with chaperone function